MAIFHLSVTQIKRSAGRSAIAAAAYRACTKLYDKRQGLSFDYSKKLGLVKEQIFVPTGAPAWMLDREKVWNHLESLERQRNGQPAREVQVALPCELTEGQNWALAEEIAQHFVEQGMLADVAFHAGHGNEQPHLHIMLSMREYDHSIHDFKKTKNREWNKKSWVQDLRVYWQDLTNRHLALHGHDVRIDHRSNEARGINLIPQNKIGVSAASAKRDIANGKTPWESERLAQQAAIARANAERIIANPDIALTALSQQQSTFSDADIARLANRQSVDNTQFAEVYQAILASPNLVGLGKNAKGEMRYTSRELLEIESALIASIETMASNNGHQVSAKHVEKAINDKTLSPSQAAVLEAVIHGKDAVGVVGFAGTGKTHLLGAARQAWEAQGYNVRGLALAGKAADGLVNEAGIDSRTIASRLLAWENGRERVMRNDILVIDEAGMVDSRLLKAVIDVAEKAGAKVVLVGDHTQLQPIGAGAAFRAILQRIGFTSLTDIRRQKVPWMREASKQFALGQTKEALAAYNKAGFVHEWANQEMALDECAKSWWTKRQADVAATMTAYMRKDVLALNLLGRQRMRDAHLLGMDIPCIIHDGRTETTRSFAVGDEIYFLKNDKGLDVSGIDEDDVGVKNGTRGIITAIKDGHFTVTITSGAARNITFDINEYNHIDYAYAATVHKLQGATLDVDYFPSYNSNRYLSHVAMTRHKNRVDVHWSREGFHYGYASLEASFAREAIKDFTLDYTEPRGIVPQLVDVDGILLDEANAKKLDAWLGQVDFAAIEATQAPQLMPLLHAKAQYDIIGKHYDSHHDVYREAQTVLTQIALDTKHAHEQHQVLRGLDNALLTSLVQHPELNALETSVATQTKTVQQERPHPEQSFDAFLSSFDWNDINAKGNQQSTLATLHRHKVAYEQEKNGQARNSEVNKHQKAILDQLNNITNNPSLEKRITNAAPSLIEPLDDYKAYQREQEKLLREFKENFNQWYDGIDWQPVHAQKSYLYSNLSSAVLLYEQVKNSSDKKQVERTQEKIIQRSATLLEKEQRTDIALKLPEKTLAPIVAHAKTLEHAHRQSQSHEHSLGF